MVPNRRISIFLHYSIETYSFPSQESKSSETKADHHFMESDTLHLLNFGYDNSRKSHFDGVKRVIARRELVRHRLFAQSVVRHRVQRYRRFALCRWESSRAGRHRLASPREAECPTPSLLAPLLRTPLVLALLRDSNLTRASLRLHELSSPLHNVLLLRHDSSQ